MRVDGTRGEEMAPQPTGDRGNRPLRPSQHLHEVETHPNLTIFAHWCLNLTAFFSYQFCRLLSTYLLKQKSTLNSVTLAPHTGGGTGSAACIWIMWMYALIFWAGHDRLVWQKLRTLLFSRLLVKYVMWGPLGIADCMKCVAFTLWACFDWSWHLVMESYLALLCLDLCIGSLKNEVTFAGPLNLMCFLRTGL